MIYKWPSSLLRLVNRKLRNFLWTGSCEETKLIRVAWDRCCKPYSQCGLGLKDLGLLNDSLLKKLTWKFMPSDSFGFSFLRERYLTQLQKSHGGYVTLSLWHSFRSHYSDLLREGIWLIDLYFRIDRIAISPVADSLVWAHSRDGQVSCKSAYSRMICDSLQLPTEDRLCRTGLHLASRCSVCGVSSEPSDHLFLRCPIAAALWEAVFSAF
ncbi:hypothetical protein Dsin_005510 [Dipteronia sinensis]|uniref:Reverse transcriptase zinc-binding domain-containing protein n=1 Tax=Dipteronia sinensis TaxID=43782 RepID=A0AAE0AXE5_9ROSI|nr:hypothetical protein Dsin_005510 [Dipteronia sinensis]